jgi:hypothetical protein
VEAPKTPERSLPRRADPGWLDALLRKLRQDVEEFVIGAKVYVSGVTSLTSGAAGAALSFDTVLWDSGGLRDSANPTRLIAVKSGAYQIGTVNIFAANGTGERQVDIVKNGTDTIASSAGGAPAATDYAVPTGVVEYLDEDDYVEFLASQTSGGPLDIQAWSATVPSQVAWMIRLGSVPEDAF